MDENGAGALFAGGGMLCFLFALSIIPFMIWIYALIHAIKNPRLQDNERVIWVVVILMTHCLGATLYFIMGKK